MEQRFSIICLSSQDWDAELKTNRQQIMLRAARRNHQILFVETGHFIGRHVWTALAGRSRGSLMRRLLATEKVAPGIRVRKALNLVPWGKKYRPANFVNNFLTGTMLRLLGRRLAGPIVLWIYDPCTSGLTGSCDEAFAVYDCVDDYREQVGADGRRRALVAAADELAARRSRLVFATTKPLVERHRRLNPKTYHVPNAADFEHFKSALDRERAAPETRTLRPPVLVFAGSLSAYKVDFDLLQELAAGRPGWTFLLVGPVSRDSRQALDRLLPLPNVSWVGQKPYSELPRYIAAADVGIIPYASSPYTRACFPLKLYEYLAAGKPVVASGLPELEGMEPDVVVTEGAGEFVSAVEESLGHSTAEDRGRRVALAAQNTWETRTERLLELVSSGLGG